MTKATIDERIEVAIKNTQDLYLSDELPWVVGYSGGKDSTATLQLIWAAVSRLPVELRTKDIHVISTDTLVENPVIAIWVMNSLIAMRKAAEEQNMPIHPERLVPAVEDRFWVNLIGKGYPAPRPLFRWCTSRLKINASNTFIRKLADKSGEAILVLGTRRAESAARDRVLTRYENSTRELLSRNSDASLDRVWVYTPVSTWTSDDIWEYLIENENPWNYNNMELFHIYRGATPDSECPLVVDKSTPSCGDSRFGCFVCTMVTEDKSMQAMIQNDDDKLWMKPLLDFRNEYLKTDGDRSDREFTKMDGSLQLQFLNLKGEKAVSASRLGKVVDERVVKRLEIRDEDGFAKPNRRVLIRQTRMQEVDGENIESTQEFEKVAVLVHGPYTQKYRHTMLAALLNAQEAIRENLPPSIADFSVITPEELEEIRRIWVNEKREFEDAVPEIYARSTGRLYNSPELDEATPFRPEDLKLLNNVCQDLAIETVQNGPLSSQDLLFRVIREQLSVQHGYRSASRRVGLQAELENILENQSFSNESEALDFALQRKAGGMELMQEQQENVQVLAFMPKNLLVEEYGE